MWFRVRLFFLDRSSYSAASHCGPTRLAIWRRSIATPLAIRSDFGSLNYIADIRGDLIFNGFETAAITLPRSDEHDLNLSSDHIQEIAPVTALALGPEHTATSKDWRFNPTMEAIDSPVLEPHMALNSHNIFVTGTPDSSPGVSSEPCESTDAELDRLSNFEFSATYIFQHSPLGDVLSSLKNLSLAGDP